MKPVKISRYPDYLIDLARGAGKVRRIPLKDKRAAEAMRFELYGLRRAIEKEGAEDLYPEFMRAVVRIEEGTVVVSPPDEANEETRRAVLAALGEDYNPGPAPTLETHKPQKVESDPYALYMQPEQHDTALVDQEFELAIDAWLASAPIQDTQHTGDEPQHTGDEPEK